MTRAFQIPVDITVNSATFSAGGEVDIRRTDFDIAPFSALNEALAVKNQPHIVFHLRGERSGLSG